MKLPISWLREFVDVPADPLEIGRRLGACGFAIDGLDSDVLDVDVTANRPDCLSVYGLAREVAAAFGAELKPPPGSAGPAETATGSRLRAGRGSEPADHASMKISVGDAGCGRYALAVLTVTVGPSPDWLSARLRACGVRPINTIVDVTNYVMLELGQPMHAFDAARLTGSEIRVRRARPGEHLTTLDGNDRELDETMLVIADREKAVAVAGVMGGASSEVSPATTRIALESAWFLPTSVRQTSRKLGLKTEASARFERGADPKAVVAAIERALELFTRIGGIALDGGITDVWPKSNEPRVVPLRHARLNQLLGATVPPEDAEAILHRLAFQTSPSGGGWQVTVPSFRVDVSREADLIEEVGRHWGFDRIDPRFPPLRNVPRGGAPSVASGRRLRRLLCGAGLQEAATFTFIDASAAGAFAATDDLVAIANPLSEKFAVMRPSLMPGLIESLDYNRHRQAATVRLFEIGTVFSASRGERTAVGWVLTGLRTSHWSEEAGEVDFSDTKGLAELLGTAHGASLEPVVADDLPWLVAGQRAALTLDGERIGWIGRLAGTDSTASAVFAGQVDLAPLDAARARRARAVTPLPRYPSAARDLSIVVDERLPAASVRGTIRSNAPATLVGIREFDRYQGKGVPDGHVSLSVRLTFQSPDRTLTDGEVHQAIETIVAALGREHQATLRGR